MLQNLKFIKEINITTKIVVDVANLRENVKMEKFIFYLIRK